MRQTAYAAQSEPQSVVSIASPLHDSEYESAVNVLHPLAFYAQRKASEEWKARLGDDLADSTDPDIIECLYEGLLAPYLQALISTHGPIEIESTHWLSLMRLIQVLLMEWMESDKLKEKLLTMGCVFHLMKVLQRMTTTMHLTSDKFAQNMIQTAAIIVNNSLTDHADLYMRLYPETDIRGSLKPYFVCPSPIVQAVCRMTYYLFSHYLNRFDPVSIVAPDDTLQYCCLLDEASRNHESFEAVQNRIFLIDANTLLKTIQLICVNEENCKVVLESCEFYTAFCSLLQHGRTKEAEHTLNLLLSLLTYERKEIDSRTKEKKKGGQPPWKGKKVREMLRSMIPNIQELIMGVSERHGNLHAICSAMLWCISETPSPESDLLSCLSYVQCCYDYKHYSECCDWVDFVRQQKPPIPEEMLKQFLLCKGKAKFHVYQKEHVVLRILEKVQDLSEIKRARIEVFPDAKEVISILGSLRGKGVSDKESEKFFDYAVMDYIRELNKETGSRQKRKGPLEFYCMLCCKKRPLVQSHIVPLAILRKIFPGDHPFYMVGPSSLSFESSLISSSRKLVFRMLCDKCDNEILSADEKLFAEKVVSVIYREPRQHMQGIDTIAYEEWLYRFCAGIIFRGLALTRGITGSSNAEDIHTLIHQCRSVVLSSVATPEEQPKLALFFTPGIPADTSSGFKTSNLVTATYGGTYFRLSDVPLAGLSPNTAKKCYFFAAHFGIFTIVALLERVPVGYEPFLVDPKGGSFSIPENDQRFDLTPSGLMVMYKKITRMREKLYIESGVEDVHRIPKLSGEKEITDRLFLLESKSAEAKMESGLVPTDFNLLPPKFVLDRATNNLILPEGHKILLHFTHYPNQSSSSTSHTVVLAVSREQDWGIDKPYVIVNTCVKSINQTFGYLISPKDFSFRDKLPGGDKHTTMMKFMREKKMHIFESVCKLIAAAFKRAGFSNYQSLLYHIERISTHDRKCRAFNNCWYCCRKCDICMEASTPGLLVFSKAGTEQVLGLKFCSDDCKSFSGPLEGFLRPGITSKVLMDVTFVLLNHNCLRTIQSTLILHLDYTVLDASGTHTHAVLDVYRAGEGSELQEGSLFTLFHLRSFEYQVFGEFSLTDDLRLVSPLPHVDKHFQLSDDAVTLINSLLHEGNKCGVMENICLPAVQSSEDQEHQSQDALPDSSNDETTAVTAKSQTWA